VRVLQPKTSAELLAAIQALQSDVIKHGVRLVVLDSVAALPRGERLLEQERGPLRV
jgi:RecA/RadA recombinase